LKSTNYKWLASSSKGTAKGQHFLLQLMPGVMLKLKGISMSEENYKKTIEVKGSTHRQKA